MIDFLQSTSDREDVVHAFFLVNPINVIIAKMFIDYFGISQGKVEIISLRGTETSLLCNTCYSPTINFLDRLRMKFFSISGTGIRIRKHLEQTNKRFVIYTSWMYPEIEEVSRSKSCAGVVYIEEGQQSYYSSPAYEKHKKNCWAQRKPKIFNGSVDYYFREDYSACVGLSIDSFPLLDDKRKIVLSNFDAVASVYSEKLSDIDCIGITPAPRRIPISSLNSLARAFCNAMPRGGVVKLHPGFKIHTELRDRFIEEIERLSGGSISCASDDVIIELEMLSKKKKLYGCRSSVSRYAELFGSEYHNITFDGYIEPKN